MRAALALGRAAGSLSYLVSRRRRIALDNLTEAYRDQLSPQQVERIARGVFRHVGQSAAESMWLRGRLTTQRLDEIMVLEGWEQLQDAFSRGRGVMLITAHIGNWEIGAHVLAVKFGPIYSVAKPLKNKRVDEYVNCFREACAQVIIDRSGALRELVRVLREGRLVIILADQHAHAGGIQVKFFGRDAWTVTAPAAIALRLGCPVALGYCYRDDDGLRHHVVLDEIVEFTPTGDREGDIRRATEYMTQKIEGYVRLRPEQWFWLHRRWKLGRPAQPKGATVERSS